MVEILAQQFERGGRTFPVRGAVIGADQGLGIDPDKLNVNGGASAIGHLLRDERRPVGRPRPAGMKAPQRRYAVVTMCVGGGMGAAGLFEVT